MANDSEHDTKQAWNEVGERITSWGRHVAGRYHEASGSTGEEARQAQRKLEEGARQLTEQLNRAFSALGDTFRDPQAKEDLKGAVRALGDAVSVTVAETGEELRRRFRTSDDASSDSPAR